VDDQRDGKGRFRAGHRKVGGRQRKRRDLKAACTALTGAALEVLKCILRDPDARDADKIQAARIILNYGHGMPGKTRGIKAEGEFDMGSRWVAVMKELAAERNQGKTLEHPSVEVIEFADPDAQKRSYALRAGRYAERHGLDLETAANAINGFDRANALARGSNGATKLPKEGPEPASGAHAEAVSAPPRPDLPPPLRRRCRPSVSLPAKPTVYEPAAIRRKSDCLEAGEN
jgi:hypothetical protein